MSTDPHGNDCPTCQQEGRRGYCALRRCYCAHEECPAYPSWTPLPPPPDVTEISMRGRVENSEWAERAPDSSWIDQL